MQYLLKNGWSSFSSFNISSDSKLGRSSEVLKESRAGTQSHSQFYYKENGLWAPEKLSKYAYDL